MPDRSGTPRLRFTALTVLAPFGLGYYLSYLFRTVNAVIAPDLARDLSLSAAELGLLTSAYFLTLAAFQLPLGVLLDRFGARPVQGALLGIAAAGSALFAVAENLLLLTVARGIVGLGVSGCLMAAFKANVQWFDRDRLPLVNAVIAAFGAFGALSATIPVEVLNTAFGWRAIFGILAVATVVVIVMTLVLVPTDRHPAGPVRRSAIGDGFRAVYSSRFFWRVTIITFLHNAVFMSYQSLWIGPWLRDVAGFAGPAIADALFWFNIGMFAGVLAVGAIADRLQSFGVSPMAVVGVGIAGSIAVQILLAGQATSIAVPLCLCFGFFGSSTLLVYAVYGQKFAAEVIGRVNTTQNLFNFVSTFVIQWGIGIIISLFPSTADGRYDPVGHRTALLIVIGLEIGAFLWFLWPRRDRLGARSLHGKVE